MSKVHCKKLTVWHLYLHFPWQVILCQRRKWFPKMRKRYRILSVLAQFLFHYKKQFFESATFELKSSISQFYFIFVWRGEGNQLILELLVKKQNIYQLQHSQRLKAQGKEHNTNPYWVQIYILTPTDETQTHIVLVNEKQTK